MFQSVIAPGVSPLQHGKMRMIMFSVCTAIAFALSLSPMAAHAQTNSVLVRLDDETRGLLRESNSDKWFKKDTFASTVLGGALAAVSGFAATGLAFWLQNRTEKRKDDAFVKGVLLAIRYDLRTWRVRYESGSASIGKSLNETEEGEYLKIKFTETPNPFAIYEANAKVFGKLPPELTKLVIGAYGGLKSHMALLRINNELLDQLNEALRDQFRENSTEQYMGVAKGRINMVKQQLVANRKALLNDRDGWIKAYEDVYKALDDAGIQ